MTFKLRTTQVQCLAVASAQNQRLLSLECHLLECRSHQSGADVLQLLLAAISMPSQSCSNALMMYNQL